MTSQPFYCKCPFKRAFKGQVFLNTGQKRGKYNFLLKCLLTETLTSKTFKNKLEKMTRYLPFSLKKQCVQLKKGQYSANALYTERPLKNRAVWSPCLITASLKVRLHVMDVWTGGHFIMQTAQTMDQQSYFWCKHPGKKCIGYGKAGCEKQAQNYHYNHRKMASIYLFLKSRQI